MYVANTRWMGAKREEMSPWAEPAYVIYCLIAFWRGLCGLSVFDGGIGRIGSLRVGSHSPIGYNSNVGGPQMPGTTGPGSP
jgi:hypothetical protein